MSSTPIDIASLYDIYLQHPSVQTDTRVLRPGDLFFALKGPHFNGNEYAQKALEAGAAACVVDENCGFTDERLIRVEDVLSTLQALALHHRQTFDVPFIAITGSNGKTTTKELVHAVLSTRYKTYTTRGNLNNHIGIPLTLLQVGRDAEMAVIEMGANHQKEIEAYCRYTQPTYGLITNCGKAHLEGFGGVEGVRKGKGELYDFLMANQGTLFLCADYDYLKTMSRGYPNSITYGSEESGATCTGRVTDESGLLRFSVSGRPGLQDVSTRLVGGYNLPNIMAAVCIGLHFGVYEEQIRQALEDYTPSNSRSQLMEKSGYHIIMDAYNANPSSMKLAIENFAAMPGHPKVLLLGSMMELGAESRQEHAEIVSLIGRYTWAHVVLVGPGFDGLSGEYLHFPDAAAARDWFRSSAPPIGWILVKGSRSMAMEKVLV